MGRDINDLACEGGTEALRLAVANGRRVPKGSERDVSNDEPVRQFGFIRLGSMPPIQPTNWLIKPFLESNSLAVMFGDPAAGKSFMAIDMACSIVTGTTWHGQRVKQGAVFYIAGEGLNNIRKRFRAWELHSPVGRPCVSVDDAIEAGASALTCEVKRRKTLARRAVEGMIASGIYAKSDEWLWVK